MQESFDFYHDPAWSVENEATRFARLMSLDVGPDFDDVAMAQQVANGLPTSVVSALGNALRRANIIGPVVSEATYRRLNKAGKPLPGEHSERIYEVARVIDAVASAFHGDATAVVRFLDTPHPLRRGNAPFDLARASSAGADAVLNLVHRAEAGVAV